MNHDDLFDGLDRDRWNVDGLLDDIEALQATEDESSELLDDILREFGSSTMQSQTPAPAPIRETPAQTVITPQASQITEPDQMEDSGVFRSYDGNREYRSFDGSMPDASPEEWYAYEEETDDSYDEDEDDYDYEDEEDYEEDTPRRKRRRHPILHGIFTTILVLLTAVSACYLLVIYSNIPFLNNLRSLYIQTAMSTINHKWLATAIVPSNMIDDVMRIQYETSESMVGVESGWGMEVQELPSLPDEVASIDPSLDQPVTTSAAPDSISAEDEENDPMAEIFSSEEADLFFQYFWELDRDSAEDYIRAHPSVLANGWAGIDINESGLDDKGTEIKTIHGDQVLAINATDGITLIRLYLSSNRSRGVMAICKDTSRLKLCVASSLGVTGQTAGRICDNNGGVLSITGSAFMDDGYANGGQISGLAVCSGTIYGERLADTAPEQNPKRLELRDDNKMYIVDSSASLGSGTRDACEFQPALIVDGKVYYDDWWNSPNPRAVLGQTKYLETMMVVVEGRLLSSLGCGTGAVADKMAEYGCVQALNLDGGTSAMMYYKGEYINLCSNPDLPGGRTLPTAWVYMPYES